MLSTIIILVFLFLILPIIIIAIIGYILSRKTGYCHTNHQCKLGKESECIGKHYDKLKDCLLQDDVINK